MKHSGAISVAPFFLRVTLGVIFVWAGLGEVLATFPVQGEQAARLANMGVYIEKNQTKPSETTPSTSPDSTPAKPTGQAQPKQGYTVALAAYNAPASGQNFTAEDFSEPVQVMQLYRLALSLDESANAVDPKDAKGNPTFHLWPKALGTGIWPLAGAWACTIAEIAGGTFLLVGLLTRFSSFVLLFNMLVAMWLTVVGPALQSGNTQLGILPSTDLLDGDWSMFRIQFILIGGLTALLFAGAGGLSIDRALFGGPTGSRPAPKARKDDSGGE